MLFIVNRLKALLLLILGGFKRALCCFRMRRRSHTNDAEDCLTHVGVVPSRNDESQMQWDRKWGEVTLGPPQTVQEHIQLYREKVANPNATQVDSENEQLAHLFEEMTPQYVKQKRVLIGNSSSRPRSNAPDLSRLAVSNEVKSGFGELGEWLEEANSGWDEQHTDIMDIMREQKRLQRESKQHSMGMGRKLKT